MKKMMLATVAALATISANAQTGNTQTNQITMHRQIKTSAAPPAFGEAARNVSMAEANKSTPAAKKNTVRKSESNNNDDKKKK